MLRNNPFFNKHSSEFAEKTQPKVKQNISQEKKEKTFQIPYTPVLQNELQHTNLEVLRTPALQYFLTAFL